MHILADYSPPPPAGLQGQLDAGLAPISAFETINVDKDGQCTNLTSKDRKERSKIKIEMTVPI